MKKVSKIKRLFLGMFFISASLLAQVDVEDKKSKEEKFKDAYFESLTQKGIENYDKAIASLDDCLDLEPENPLLFHEKGKNYFFQKDYINAEQFYNKAINLDQKNKWYLIDLYEVHYQTKNYPKAIDVIQKIIPLDKKYEEDLVSLYMYTQQFDKAWVLINNLDLNVGSSELRDRYKLQIASLTKPTKISSNNLEQAVKNQPDVEENYLSLIYNYSDNYQEQKAYETALLLEKNVPNSAWAQVFLYKHHLSKNDGNSAVKSLETVFASSKIDKKVKFKMYNEFLIFTLKNPAFETQLNKATVYFENDSDFNVYQEIGKFYYKKKNYILAVKNLEKASNTDFETNLFLLAAYEELAFFDKLQAKASDLVDTFPNQPEYYFFAGKSSNKLKKQKQALDFLESGLDYVVNNKNLELDFLNELLITTKELGLKAKTDSYLSRINSLKTK